MPNSAHVQRIINRQIQVLYASMITLLKLVTIVMAIAIFFFGLSQTWLALVYRRSKRRNLIATPPPVWQGPLPSVMVQLPIYNEIYVIERLLRAAGKFDYPKELLTIQLLDDSTDETTTIAAKIIAELSAQGIKIEHVRRVDRSGYKAGALKAGMALNESEFIAIFDADFIPQPDFIKRVIGYFANPKIGMVQTRWEHLNANYSLLTKVLAFGIDGHFSMEQGGRQADESFINFNGTAGMWRRATIIDAGGWSSDCLTEDLDLSFRSQLRGWKFLFVEDVATPSELPVQMSAIRSQQFRWTKGAAETGRKLLPLLWAAKVPLKTKVIGTFHFLNILIFPGVLIFSLLSACYALFLGDAAAQEFLPIGIILTVSTVMVVFAYSTSQTHGDFKGEKVGFLKAALTSFQFMFFTSGLGTHNSIAVLEGLMGRS